MLNRIKALSSLVVLPSSPAPADLRALGGGAGGTRTQPLASTYSLPSRGRNSRAAHVSDSGAIEARLEGTSTPSRHSFGAQRDSDLRGVRAQRQRPLATPPQSMQAAVTHQNLARPTLLHIRKGVCMLPLTLRPRSGGTNVAGLDSQERHS